MLENVYVLHRSSDRRSAARAAHRPATSGGFGLAADRDDILQTAGAVLCRKLERGWLVDSW